MAALSWSRSFDPVRAGLKLGPGLVKVIGLVVGLSMQDHMQLRDLSLTEQPPYPIASSAMAYRRAIIG